MVHPDDPYQRELQHLRGIRDATIAKAWQERARDLAPHQIARDQAIFAAQMAYREKLALADAAFTEIRESARAECNAASVTLTEARRKRREEDAETPVKKRAVYRRRDG